MSNASKSRRQRHIGIFGGTFDPIHLAHLRCAEEALELLGLDRILFVPAATPPHKTRRPVAEAADRLAMVRLAIAGNPAFRACAVEIERGGRSYSIDTLRVLRQQFPAATHLTLLLGLDAFREISTWKDYRVLFTLADIAVLSRPPLRIAAPRALLPVAVRREFCYSDDGKGLVHRSGKRILFLTVTPLDISASAIRLRAQRGQSLRYLVPPGVERYVRREQLYARVSRPS